MKTNLFKSTKFLSVLGAVVLVVTALSLFFIGCGESSIANEASGSPENFAAVLTTTAGEAKLTWDAPAEKGTIAGVAATDISYKVYSSSSDISDTAELTPVDAGADLSYTFSGTAGESWYFAVTANNGGADSPLAKIGPFTLANQLQLDANGGTGAVETKVFSTGDTTAIPAPTGIAKTGSTLAAWNTAADGSGTYYDLTEEIILTADLTLYAVWSTDGLAYTLINSDAEYSVSKGTATATEIDVPGYWMGKKVTEVGTNAFEIYNFTDIKLPSTIKSIGIRAFYLCSNLALTSLPDGVTSIGNYAFYDCSNLALTSLPDGVTSIGNNAFDNCTNLALTSLPDGIKSIGDQAFLKCSNLALTSLPDGITSIGDYAFASCSNLALTSLPDGITSLGNQAFAGTTMTSMTIPASVTSLGSSLFNNNGSITEITLEGDYSELSNIFGSGTTALATVNIPNDTTPATLSGTVFPSSVTSIKVPATAVDTYKTATGWTGYAGKISAYSS
ncbi:MAG: hypothetical protein B0D92_08550 [Spirochaeta sp. LUC14_002_19_P3]|nr:MAG: hypothetical protein B0D92_08550 [Spirochaeta sp. LUC14_002_19_P3]